MSEPSNLAPRTVLTVCRTCRPEGASSEEAPAGAALGRAAAEALRRLDPSSVVDLKAIACLSACGRACTASVAAPGKFGYVIGGLVPADAQDLATFALRHSESSDGVPPWRARPERIRKNTVARVPAPGCDHLLVEAIEDLRPVDEVQEGA